MILQLEGQMLRVLAAEHRAGGGKMPGGVHARLQHVATGTVTDRRFRPEEKAHRRECRAGDHGFPLPGRREFLFLHPVSFEQIPVARQVHGLGTTCLQPGMRPRVETAGEQVTSVVFPEIVELRVASTAQSMHQHKTSALKKAVLESGSEVQVPLFIKEGELVRIEVATGKYLERVKEAGKK